MKEGPKTLFIQKVIFDSSDHPFLAGCNLDLFSDLNGYVLASDVFVNSLPVVGLKSFGLSPEKFLTLELSDVKEEFY